MVRLEEQKHGRRKSLPKKFQFQNGTIRSWVIIGGESGNMRFQFQNGTIRSGNGEICIIHQSYFNSKMVRLEDFPQRNTPEKFPISIPKWYD